MKKILLILFNLLLLILLIILVEDGFRHTTEPVREPANQKEGAPNVLQLLKNDSPELFDKSSLKDFFKVGQRIDKSQIKSIDNLLGNFDGMTEISNNIGAASGWFFSGEDQVDFILFIDNENKVLGAGLIGIERPGLSKEIGKENADFDGWVGFLKLDGNMQQVHAICKFKNKEAFYNIGSMN
ncbi:hypothetical protein [Paenibacillus taichungensis]|uniref:hypothetical protein n=1 Tax=Paenibacillus taichungensis TaxID=484184 RepID=UPI003D9A3296